MSWSTWGLQRLGDDAPANAVLGSGRVITHGVDEYRATVVETLSARWTVSSVEVPSASLLPRPGDVVIWRATDRADASRWFVWGGPTRVLSVGGGDRPGTVEICSLEDGSLDELECAEDDEWLQELVGVDREIPVFEEWDLLELWGLYPHCARCGGRSRSIVHGMTMGDDADSPGLVFAGCVVPPDPPSFQCSVCGHEFSTFGPYVED